MGESAYPATIIVFFVLVSRVGLEIDTRWFHPVLARVRDDNMTEIEYVRQVRLGNVPWQSKVEISEQLVQAQYDWTSRNMLTVATLFAVGPEGSAVREKYFGAEAVTVTEVEAESEAEPILGEDIGPIEA